MKSVVVQQQKMVVVLHNFSIKVEQQNRVNMYNFMDFGLVVLVVVLLQVDLTAMVMYLHLGTFLENLILYILMVVMMGRMMPRQVLLNQSTKIYLIQLVLDHLVTDSDYDNHTTNHSGLLMGQGHSVNMPYLAEQQTSVVVISMDHLFNKKAKHGHTLVEVVEYLILHTETNMLGLWKGKLTLVVCQVQIFLKDK